MHRVRQKKSSIRQNSSGGKIMFLCLSAGALKTREWKTRHEIAFWTVPSFQLPRFQSPPVVFYAR